MSTGQELVHFEAARSALALARNVDEVKGIRDTAVAVAAYARQAKDTTLIANATEIRARAERRLGELIAERRDSGGLHPGGRPSKPGPADHPVSLSELGIDKHLADRARKAAAMPPPAFEAALAETRVLAVAFTEGDRSVIRAARERRQAAKLERREQRERELGKRIRMLPERRFGVIYADPPWRWQAWSEQTGSDRAAANHYPTMGAAEISSLPVAGIAADDAVLWLWATAPMLSQALAVVTAWGFIYRSHLVWAKDRIGTGYWARSQHELLLIGTRGSVPAPSPGSQPASVIEAPVGRHSEKPPVFAEIIEGLFPTLPKVELFARKVRPGWDGWGYEATDQFDDSGQPEDLL